VEALSKDELLRLLATARARRERDWLLILVAFWHGLRASEVIGITRDDIKGEYLTVKRLKGSEETTQLLVEHENPLLSERAALLERARESTGNQPLFPITRQHFWRLFQAYCQAAQVPAHKAHPHALKHTIGTLMIENTPINEVHKRLGHKSIASTGEYMKASDADADAVVVGATGL